ncbi:hypothetical protein [Actinomadura sp. HBU206391]|uniref:hypothetical protein n=1 Tax=Actinomadura sp. HBU206391 TaxID=2731692 RepID=UPI0021C6EF8A|nr:hypothetical protein [Actinomadura sp. HBU206391]
MAETKLTEVTAETMVAEVLAELAGLEDPKTRGVNEKHGDDHGVNLSRLRAGREAAEDAAGTRVPALGDR